MVMRRRSTLIFAILFGAATAPAWLHPPATSRAADPPAAAAGPVIVELVGRDQKITISGSADEPRYTVRRQGRIVADRVTLSQLESLDPTSYEQVQSATADASDGRSAPTIWAGVE
jgi:hypothetical protein